jgi:hypothetical protein
MPVSEGMLFPAAKIHWPVLQAPDQEGSQVSPVSLLVLFPGSFWLFFLVRLRGSSGSSSWFIFLVLLPDSST